MTDLNGAFSTAMFTEQLLFGQMWASHVNSSYSEACMRQFSCVLEPLLAPTHDSEADLIDLSEPSINQDMI